MKRRLALCLTMCVLVSLVVVAERPTKIQTVYTGVSHVYLPDGTYLMSIPWPVMEGAHRITGEVTHYMDLNWDGHIINDGQGRERGQQFRPDPFLETFRDRVRITGTMEIIMFDEVTGTYAGTCYNTHEIFGTADEILPVYPWAQPMGSANGQGWWFAFTEVQIFIPVFEP